MPARSTRQQKATLARIPKRNREHSIHSRDKIHSVFLIQMRNDFAVAGAFKAIAFVDQVPTQLAIVIDFTVEDHDDGAGCVHHGLIARVEVDDCQPSHAEANPGCNVDSLAVRTAVQYRIAHCLHAFARGRFVHSCESRYAAHDRGLQDDCLLRSCIAT